MSASIENRRPADLVAALAAVRSRLADAAASSGRDAWSITLIAVTKTFPASDIAILLGLGVADVAESRDQEARAKLAQLAALQQGAGDGLPPRSRLRMHFVGRLQTNKCRSVARYASCVHTVDRSAVLSALAEGVVAAERDPLPVFVQVSLDGDPARGGAPLADLSRLADEIVGSQQLELLGVMAVAPQDLEPAQAYARLAGVSAQLRDAHPGALAISAGMSGDFEAAVKYGATHVRIGSALLGRRDVTFG